MDEPDAGVLIVADRGAVRHLTLDRPHALNALNSTVLRALEQALGRIAGEPSVRAVIVSGSGERAFCAGADLDELAGAGPDEAHAFLRRGQSVLRSLERCGVPTIAAVDGYALGGGFELALACTLIVASERARFGLPEAGLGLIPGFGGTQRLPRAIGQAAARRLMITGERLAAEDAYRLGLLAQSPVGAGEALQAAEDLAQRVTAASPSAVRMILELTDPEHDGKLAHETALAALAATTADGREGIAAFRDKRAPVFASVAGDGSAA